MQGAILLNPVADTVTMMTSSDMANWMLILAGIIPSQLASSDVLEQAVDGKYEYTEDDLCILQRVNPRREVDKECIVDSAHR